MGLSEVKRKWVHAFGAVEDSGDTEAPERFVQPNRHVTMLVYLNEVQEGGETVFPKAPVAKQNPKPIVRPGMPDCSRGLTVAPYALGAAMFYHKHGDGTNDPLSAHGGCPPLRGDKWAINSFMWNVP